VATACYGTTAPGNGGMFVSTNSGLGWAKTNKMMQLNAVACSADGTKIAALGYYILYSTNSGSNWTQSITTDSYWTSLAMSADGTKLAAATTYDGVYVSTNAGSTWTQYSTPNKSWTSLVSSADGGRLAAVDSGKGVYTSTKLCGQLGFKCLAGGALVRRGQFGGRNAADCGGDQRIDLYFDQLGQRMGIEQRAHERLVSSRLIRRWRQTCRGGQWRRNFHLLYRPAASNVPRCLEPHPGFLMDGSFDELCIGANYESDQGELGQVDQHASFELHESTIPGNPAADQPRGFLPAGKLGR
jgi:hypothetical protein